VLPNDPKLHKLTPLQIAWIVGHLREDAEKLADTFNGKGEKKVFSIDDDVFTERIKHGRNR